MQVIIKLDGLYIGSAFMTQNEIKNAQKEGFTILRRENK